MREDYHGYENLNIQLVAILRTRQGSTEDCLAKNFLCRSVDLVVVFFKLLPDR